MNKRLLGRLTIGAVIIGALLRISVLAWQDPWGPHHPDEHLLPLDALGLWEGVTPREVGWPASTTRLVLSAAAGVQWLAEEGMATWNQRHDPPRALEAIARWVGARYADPAPLYRLGRWLSVVTGILQLVATAWALKQWVGPLGIFIGTLVAAIAPLLVVYSQYVLADITALLFATILVGQAAQPTAGRIVAMGALGGLAMASKFHFGLWMLTPITCAALMRHLPLTRRLGLAALASVAGGGVVLMLVPWFWLDPFLSVKEFGGVVAVKVGSGASAAQIARNISLIFDGLGTAGWLGALLGVLALQRGVASRMQPIVVPLAIGTLALASSATVFDRYGLVLVPALAVLCAYGWESWIARPAGRVMAAAATALGLAIVLTGVSVWRSQQTAGEYDVDALAKKWVLEHVARGRRVAVFDEVNAFLPRVAAQLDVCIADVESPESYARKWAVLGYEATGVTGQPMRSMLLTDEEYRAHWCRRERMSQQDPGYYVVYYHPEARFRSFLESDVLREFTTNERAVTGGVDVLVMNRDVDVGQAPAAVLQTARGRRVIYMR